MLAKMTVAQMGMVQAGASESSTASTLSMHRAIELVVVAEVPSGGCHEFHFLKFC